MLFIFPIIYFISFLQSLLRLIERKIEDFLVFFVFGLPIYTTSLSLSFLYGLGFLVPVMQSFKEISVIAGLSFVLYHWKRKIQLHLIDKLLLLFFVYTFIYVLLPIGQYGFIQKLIAFKSLSFFTLASAGFST